MERVKDYTKFTTFDYTNGKNVHKNPFKCGDIVLDVDEPKDQAIGVVIQVHNENELRTDMFGNASAENLKGATYEEISKWRKDILPEIADYETSGYIVGVEGDESVGILSFEMEVAHELSFQCYADFLRFKEKILEAYSYVYDETMLYFETFEYRKEVNDYYDEYLRPMQKQAFNVGDKVSFYIIEDFDVQPEKCVGVILAINDYHVYTDMGTVAIDFVRHASEEEIKEFRPDLVIK